MKAKAYDFRYTNTISKLLQHIFSIIANTSYPVVICILLFFIMSICDVVKYLSLWMIVVMFSVSAISGVILTIKYFVTYKGIILYDSYMEICKNSLVDRNFKMVLKIDYDNILSIYNSSVNLRQDRKKAKNLITVFGDYSNYVEVTLKGGKQFCFSIEEQDDFVKEVIKRMEKLQKDADVNT